MCGHVYFRKGPVTDLVYMYAQIHYLRLTRHSWTTAEQKDLCLPAKSKVDSTWPVSDSIRYYKTLNYVSRYTFPLLKEIENLQKNEKQK